MSGGYRNNPFEDPSGRGGIGVGTAAVHRPSGMTTAAAAGGGGGDPPIWAARNVEWPLPISLSAAQYGKLLRASRQAAASLGIATVGGSGGGVPSASQGGLEDDAGGGDSKAYPDGGGGGLGAGPAAGGTASSSYAGGLVSGFMSRVLSTSAASSDSRMMDDLGSDDHLLGFDGSIGVGHHQRPIRSPRPGCVAAANGWIVAVVEGPASLAAPPGDVSGVGGTGAVSAVNNAPCLRLISRWNVRRGGGLADPWMVLPTPAHGDAGRIAHVFADPTGSHVLVSAYNGEAYYLHSSQKVPVKLPGFGDTAPGGSVLSSLTLTGISASAAMAGGRPPASIQQGLTPHTHVTGVAWNKERGTEGSSKKILLGTSGGEIYEYSLHGPNSDGASDPDGNAGSGLSAAGGASASALPMLLHRMHGDTDSGPPAAVTGIYLEKLRTGLLLLVATSGRHKRTRFCTFYSPQSNTASFSSLFYKQPSQGSASGRQQQPQQHTTLTELPGSVEFADLQVCNDSFGLRTATGIYCGRIDRNYTPLSGSSPIVESEILPYDVLLSPLPAAGSSRAVSSSSASSIVPISLAVTPHHIITLSDTYELRFVNRVALKVVQKERLVEALDSLGDEGALTSGSASASSGSASAGGNGELLMDIRRPDQVWLRRGRSLVHISSSQEDRDVWKFTLQKCLDFPAAGVAAIKTTTGGSRPGTTTAAARAALLSGTPALISEEEKAVENLFEQAKGLCSNSHQKAVVAAIRAEYHLQHGRAELAAKYLAQCPPRLVPFADAAVRLALPKLGVDAHDDGLSPAARESLEASNLPLIAYLSDKMRVSAMNDDKMASTMIGAWLTELYLHERGERVGSAAALVGDAGSTVTVKDVEAHHRSLLARFLNSHVNHMDAKTIMKILTSHDVGAGECAVYAARSGDISTAVNAALSVRGDDASGAFEALQIMDDAPFELSESLYYKHAPILLARAPSAAGESFLSRYSHGLSPLRLLPSIMHYENARTERQRKGSSAESVARKSSLMSGVEESKGSYDGFELHVRERLHANSFVDDPDVSINYLEGVIKQGCRSSAVYSYLLSLYAKLEDEEPLFVFLSTHVPVSEITLEASTRGAFSSLDASQEDVASPLDMSYALRTVLGTGRHFRSAIKLYMGFGMRQHAVELALKVDPSLARELAQESVEIDERKRLWLMIAKNAASDSSTLGGKDVVSKVVSVLKDCGPEVLSIEDVLPFLPDFAQIDQIKDQICEALTSYSSKIEAFLNEMNECDQVCDRLRDEIGRLRNHRMRMKGDARCAFTHRLVLDAGEPFYIFPSGYVVLASALRQHVIPYLNDRQRAQVIELEARINTGGGYGSASLEDLQTELDGLLAAECPLTGTSMVDSIDREFEGCAETDEAGGIFRSSVERVEV